MNIYQVNKLIASREPAGQEGPGFLLRIEKGLLLAPPPPETGELFFPATALC